MWLFTVPSYFLAFEQTNLSLRKTMILWVLILLYMMTLWVVMLIMPMIPKRKHMKAYNGVSNPIVRRWDSSYS